VKRFLRSSCRFLFSVLGICLLCPPGLSAGELRGRVIVPRQSKSPAPRRYYKGPYRSGHAHGAIQDGPENVVVYLPDLANPPMLPSRPEPVMRQVNERFVPHVLAVTRGNLVRFPNEDDFYHNVFSVVAGDRFDLGRYAKGEKASNPFDTSGVVVVRCEIHSRMKAYILVLETEAFTVPDASGSFVFPSLPDGRHRVAAWHPTSGTWEGFVDVSGDAPTSITITI